MDSINAKKAAVLGLHWLNDIVAEDGAHGSVFYDQIRATNVIGSTQKLLSAARAYSAAVIYTRVAFRPDHSDLVINCPLYEVARDLNALVDGTWGSEIVAELEPQPGDHVISNTRLSGFMNSSLEFMLRNAGIDTLILSGVATNMTVESTARAASDLGFRTIVVSDCVCADASTTHEASLGNMSVLGEVVPLNEVVAAFS